MNLPEILNTAIGASIPVLIFYWGYLIKRRQDKIEGKHRNRVQFELEANSFGPQNGHFVVEINMVLANEGLVRNKLEELFLTIKGIRINKDIGLFQNLDFPINIAEFPEKIVKTNVLNSVDGGEIKKGEDKKKWFVEPGIIQRFTYVVRIPEHIRFILVRSHFKYHEKSKHNVQKMFELQ